MYSGLRLGRINGIEIVADWSLLIIFMLITFSLALGMFPTWHPDWTPQTSWLTALAAAVLFFTSVTAHELSHALVGRHGGVHIRRITLFAFGGMAHMESEPPSWDGGRVLRSIAWGLTGSLQRATRLASFGGQVFAWLLMSAGFAMALEVRVPLFGTGFAGGLWLVLIGWFLNNAAIASYRQLLISEALENVPVADLMLTNIVRVAPGVTIRELVDRYVMASGQRVFPVENTRGDFLGLVSLRDIGKLERNRWESATVEEIMASAADLTKLSSQQRTEDEIVIEAATATPVHGYDQAASISDPATAL